MFLTKSTPRTLCTYSLLDNDWNVSVVLSFYRKMLIKRPAVGGTCFLVSTLYGYCRNLRNGNIREQWCVFVTGLSCRLYCVVPQEKQKQPFLKENQKPPFLKNLKRLNNCGAHLGSSSEKFSFVKWWLRWSIPLV